MKKSDQSLTIILNLVMIFVLGFPCRIAFSVFTRPRLNTRGFGAFETVLQAREAVEGLHNFEDTSYLSSV